MFEKMTAAERIVAAKEKTKRVVDHLLYLIDLHEANAIVLYSPALSPQIPQSYAANAFNVFQGALHRFELVRLCALWDAPELPKENIPTIIELIDAPEIIAELQQETAKHWTDMPSRLLNPSEHAEERELIEAAVRQNQAEFGKEQGEKATAALHAAIQDARAIRASERLASIMNLRDKHLAHSLSETRREKRAAVQPMKYGDEKSILEATVPIVEALYCYVSSVGFSFEDSRRISAKYAKALWHHCRFDIEARG